MSTKILKIALFDATGTPGIGEVVYGTRQQLLLVARNWRMERDNCRGTQFIFIRLHLYLFILCLESLKFLKKTISSKHNL